MTRIRVRSSEQGKSYAVVRFPDGKHACECKSFLYRGTCRHCKIVEQIIEWREAR